MATTKRSLVLWAALLVTPGCKDEPSSVELARKEAASKPAAEATRSNVTIVKTPVPYGVKIPCTQLLPDPAKIGAALGKEVVVEDKSQTDQDAASVCAVKLAGQAPSAAEQKKMWEKNNRVLGVLPGDEVCLVTAYCAYVFDKQEMRGKCEKEGKRVSEDVGELTCVKEIEAGADYRYVYEVLDPDSRCKIQVNPGPSVIDEKTVLACARAASELVGPDQIRVPGN